MSKSKLSEVKELKRTQVTMASNDVILLAQFSFTHLLLLKIFSCFQSLKVTKSTPLTA